MSQAEILLFDTLSRVMSLQVFQLEPTVKSYSPSHLESYSSSA